MCGSAPEWVWLFFRTGVAKRADKCGSVTGIYKLYAARIFDNPKWVDYEAFAKHYGYQPQSYEG